MPDFETNGEILLQSADNMGYTFTFKQCTSKVANDNFIPYGLDIDSVIVTAFDYGNNDVTSQLVDGIPTVTNNEVLMNLKYPITSGEGRYKLTMALTFTNGDTKQADFHRVRVIDR